MTAPLATDKQLAFIAKLGGDAADGMTVPQASALIDQLIEQSNAAKAQAKAEAMALTPGAPKGKATIVGRVVSVKVVQNPYYGTQYKFLIEEDNGNRAYGTIPAAIRKAVSWDTDALKGARVKLSATFKRSDDDPHFSVFSHPKGEVVEFAAGPEAVNA